jgi:hypothetical protein
MKNVVIKDIKNKKQFLIFLLINLLLSYYCYSNNDTLAINNNKDTIRAKFKITSIKKIEGFCRFDCPRCTFRRVKTLGIYYKNTGSVDYYYRRLGYIRKAYYIGVELQDKNAECQIYHILSLKEPRDRKKKSEKIKIGEIYELQAIKYYDKDKKPSHFIYNISIDNILFKLNYVGCNLLLPLNLKGLYYYYE